MLVIVDCGESCYNIAILEFEELRYISYLSLISPTNNLNRVCKTWDIAATTLNIHLRGHNRSLVSSSLELLNRTICLGCKLATTLVDSINSSLRWLYRVCQCSKAVVKASWSNICNLEDLDCTTIANLEYIANTSIYERLGNLDRQLRQLNLAHIVTFVLLCKCQEVIRSLGISEDLIYRSNLLHRYCKALQANALWCVNLLNRARSVPLISLQLRTIGTILTECASLILLERCCLNIAICNRDIDLLTSKIGQIGACRQLAGQQRCTLLSRVLVSLGWLNIELNIAYGAVWSLLVLCDILLVVLLNLAVRYNNQRVGNRRVVANHETTLVGVVCANKTLLHVESVGIDTIAKESHILLRHALETSLLADKLPHIQHLWVSLCLIDKCVNTLDAVSTSCRIGKECRVDARRDLAQLHISVLSLGNCQAKVSVCRYEYAVSQDRLPSLRYELCRLIITGIVATIQSSNILVSLAELRVVNIFSINLAHLRIVAREANIVLQREDECQKRATDNNREQHAELGS